MKHNHKNKPSSKRPYAKENLGKMIVFLLPSLQLKRKSQKGESLEDKLHHFLLQKFNGYTAAAGNIFGYWRNAAGKEFYGEHKEYKVSLLKKNEIRALEDFLSILAFEMEEESIYVSSGEDSWLLYPTRNGLKV